MKNYRASDIRSKSLKSWLDDRTNLESDYGIKLVTGRSFGLEVYRIIWAGSILHEFLSYHAALSCFYRLHSKLQTAKKGA